MMGEFDFVREQKRVQGDPRGPGGPPHHFRKWRWAAALALAVSLASAQPSFKVRLSASDGGGVAQIPLERYVAGVLAGESSVFRSPEALKAMAVAARTYAVRLRGRHSAEGFDFCATTHCQRLDLQGIAARLEEAASATAGELLWWEGKPAFTCYTLDCGRRAEDAVAVWPSLAAPYLRGHEDAWCARAGASEWQWIADPRQILGALRASALRAPAALERVGIAERTATGRAHTLELSGGGQTVRISAGSLRFAIGRALGWNTLRSDRYEIRTSNGSLTFNGSGAGHGVGLCQRGAEEMGLDGHSYREILAYYYPGATLGLTGRGLPWQRISGDGIALFTTRPAADGALLALAARELRAAAGRTRLAPPERLQIRVYPDVATFRNATGEPGWVAAVTTGGAIQLQPAAVLRSRGVLDATLRHELLHALMEAHAAPGLPVWFREGLVGYLERSAVRAGARIPSDADLRQTADPARARRAYADAAAAVAGLVKRYGETAVFGWVTAGLPEEVRKTSSSQAPTKSR
jgi:stage II sporulation protein D